MDEFNMLPIYRSGMGEISNGIDMVVPAFCKDKCECNEKCRQHYEKMEQQSTGLYQCPYGFSTYVFKIEDDLFFFTCLQVEGKYDRKKLQPKIKDENKYREITLQDVQQYAEAYKDFWINHNKYEKYKHFVDDIFHDIRKFNKQIKIKNDRLYKKSQSSEKNKWVLELARSINVISWFLTLRLNNHDFLYNEEIMMADIPSDYNIYKIIDKVRICIDDRAKEKNIKIKMSAAQDCRNMKAYDCIELLPFLILDNAIKYSPADGTIDISFEERGNQQHVKVLSLGPVVGCDELKRICNQNYRGAEARKMTDDGMGIGLYTAKCICKINHIEMKVASGSEIKKIKKNIKYSEFTVDFWINL